MKHLREVIKPIIYYLALVLILFVMGNTITGFIRLPLTLLIVVILPITLLFWNVQVMKSKIGKLHPLFLASISSIPGLLFGIQMVYQLNLMVYGYFSVKIIAPLIISGLLFGVVFGLLGLFINHCLMRAKKSIMKKVMMAIGIGFAVGILVIIALFFAYANLPKFLIIILQYSIFSPHLIGNFLCNLIDDHTFGCLSVNLYVFPFVYATIIPLAYCYFLKLKKT